MFFFLAKVPVGFVKSYLFLTDVTTAELQRLLSNISVIFNACFGNTEKQENNGTADLA